MSEKPWFASTTIVASLLGFVAGIVAVLSPHVPFLEGIAPFLRDPETATAVVGIIAAITSLVSIRGRVKAEKNIKPLFKSEKPTGPYRTPRLVLLPLLLGVAVLGIGGLPGCATSQSQTHNAAVNDQASLESNTGQNTQLWNDGSTQTGASQLDSGVISGDTTSWMASGISSVISVTKQGAQVKNSGDLEAASLSIAFGEPMSDPGTGELVVPITSIEITGLTNETTRNIEALNAQVTAFLAALPQLSEDQASARIAELERDKVVSTELAATLREIAGLVAPSLDFGGGD